VLACVALATVALVALAARSAGHEASLAQAPAQSQSLAQAQSLAPSGSRSPLQLLAQRAAKASTLWSSNTVPSSAGMIAVSEDDIDRLGLRAPPGFNVRSVNVTADDIDRYTGAPPARAPRAAQRAAYLWASMISRIACVPVAVTPCADPFCPPFTLFRVSLCPPNPWQTGIEGTGWVQRSQHQRHGSRH